MNEKIGTDQTKTRWFIDLDWYQQNNRSFPTLAQNYLCSKCRKKLDAKGKPISETELLSTIKGCCAKESGFISGQLPILENVFRLFLANGNQPLALEELGRQLSKLLGGDTYRTSAEILSRLLRNEQYYGIRPVTG